MVSAASDYTHWHTLKTKTPLEEGSASRSDLYLTTNNTQRRETTITQTGFEPEIPESKRKQKQALDCAASEIGYKNHMEQTISW